LASEPVILAFEKQGTFTYADSRGVNFAALKILRRRVDEGYWYDNWDDGNPFHQWKDRAEAIIEAALEDEEEAARRAMTFLDNRSDHEYEGFEIQYPL